jgi:TPR repeat protein
MSICFVFTLTIQAQQADLLPGTKIQTANGRNLVELIVKAERGDAETQCTLGSMYYLGYEVQQDYTESVKWYLKAADQGKPLAQLQLAVAYANGQGVPQDQTEAVKWCRKAAEQGYVQAQSNLGASYYFGVGVVRDYEEAVKWYRRAAEKGEAMAENNLGSCFEEGHGVQQDYSAALKWYRKAAEQGIALAQVNVGNAYSHGEGVPQDYREALKWFYKAADQQYPEAEYIIGVCYYFGQGVPSDHAETVKWYRKAADQGLAHAQYNLGSDYISGDGIIKDYVLAYKWDDLAAAQGETNAKADLPILEQRMTPEQIAEGQRLAREFKPEHATGYSAPSTVTAVASPLPISSGTGFFITADGFLITAAHVVNGATQIRIFTCKGLVPARLVKFDAANDLALLKTEGQFSALPIVPSRSVKLGNTAATIGFPNIALQGFSPKLSKGEIGSLTGAQDDPRYFQISVPVQPGNSGGALVDKRGNVIGVVAATSGELPENVNYAIKSSFLLGFLESYPEASSKLKDADKTDRKFEDIVDSIQAATVMVIVY